MKLNIVKTTVLALGTFTLATFFVVAVITGCKVSARISTDSNAPVEKPAPLAPGFKVGDKVVITTGRGIVTSYAHGVVLDTWLGNLVDIAFVSRDGVVTVVPKVSTAVLSHE